jgi:virulence factor Mce-like protein
MAGAAGDGEAPVGAGDRARSAGLWLVGRPWLLFGIAILVVGSLWAKSTREQPHEVKVVFDEAVSLYSGLDVRVDGLDAGKVKTIKNEDGVAVVTLGIDDDQVWPLHRGTKATIRFGSTVGNGTRIVELDPGPANGPEIPDGGIIANTETVEPTEFDDVFDTFDAKTRTALQGTLKGTGDTFGPRASQLRAGVTETPKGLASIGNLASDVSADEPALRAFVANTHRVTTALASRRDQVSDLVGVASQTFATFAANTNGIRGSLERFPATVREARTTLSRLDTSVGRIDRLVKDLRPGATQLGLLSRDLRPALADLRRTIPVAISTFGTARRASPDITSLLAQLQPFSEKATPILTDLAPMIGCLRPYAPELAALMSNWTSWNQGYDKTSHFGRVWPNAGATSFTSNPLKPEQLVAATGQGYALFRPPGYAAGKPWFQPECGITADGLDPKKDPETPK